MRWAALTLAVSAAMFVPGVPCLAQEQPTDERQYMKIYPKAVDGRSFYQALQATHVLTDLVRHRAGPVPVLGGGGRYNDAEDCLEYYTDPPDCIDVVQELFEAADAAITGRNWLVSWTVIASLDGAGILESRPPQTTLTLRSGEQVTVPSAGLRPKGIVDAGGQPEPWVAVNSFMANEDVQAAPSLGVVCGQGWQVVQNGTPARGTVALGSGGAEPLQAEFSVIPNEAGKGVISIMAILPARAMSASADPAPPTMKQIRCQFTAAAGQTIAVGVVPPYMGRTPVYVYLLKVTPA